MKKGGPVDPDEIIARILARTGKAVVDSAVLYDVAEALLQIGRPDLSAQYASRAYGMALVEKDTGAAARALTFIVSSLGADGRRVLLDL